MIKTVVCQFGTGKTANKLAKQVCNLRNGIQKEIYCKYLYRSDIYVWNLFQKIEREGGGVCVTPVVENGIPY